MMTGEEINTDIVQDDPDIGIGSSMATGERINTEIVKDDLDIVSSDEDEQKEKEETIYYCDSDPHKSKRDFFFIKDPIKPPHFQLAKTTDDELFLDNLLQHQLSIDCYYKEGVVKDCDLKYALGRMVFRLPKNAGWGAIRKFGNPDQLKQAIELAATLFFQLLPQEILRYTPRKVQRVNQLNKLWNELTKLMSPPHPAHPIEAAFLTIMSLTNDQKMFSLVTETDLADMIDYFGVVFMGSPYKRDIYRSASDPWNEDQDPWFKQIIEVLHNMELPPKLTVDDHTQVLMKTINLEPDKKWLKPFVNPNLFPKRSPRFLKDALDSLVKWVIESVDHSMRHPMLSVLKPLERFCKIDFDPSISSEVMGLIRAANIRRMAMGSHFIGRYHLIWAFYDRGHVLPPHIRKKTSTSLDDAPLPPFHIYRVSLKLAQCCSEGMSLEHFIFSVINISPSDGVTEDQRKQEAIVQGYEKFVADLKSPSPPSPRRSKRMRSLSIGYNHRHSSPNFPPRLKRSGELKKA